MNEDDLDQEDEATSRLCHNGWDQEKLVPAGGGKDGGLAGNGRLGVPVLA